MKPRWFAVVALAVLIAGLPGCSRTKPLQGKWQVDRAYTESKFPKDEESQGLLKLFITPMIKQLEGKTMTITDKEIRAEEDFTYEVVEHPTRDSWRLKTTDGKVSSYELDGEHLALTSTGGSRLKFYFKRVDR